MLQKYFFEFLKISSLYLVIRMFLDFMDGKDGFNFLHSLVNNAPMALLFGFLFAAIRGLLAWTQKPKS